jgi:hypothetical protein
MPPPFPPFREYSSHRSTGNSRLPLPNTYNSNLLAMVVFARFTAVICAVAVLVDSHAVQLAEMVEPQLSPRAEFYGGYALSATTCPADTTSCGDSSQHGCCTNGQNCITYGYEAFCCPDSKSVIQLTVFLSLSLQTCSIEQNCRSQVEALPICADTSWTLFKYSSNYFCCQSSQVGVAASGAGVCANSDVSVPFSKLATTVSVTKVPLFDNSHLRPDGL